MSNLASLRPELVGKRSDDAKARRREEHASWRVTPEGRAYYQAWREKNRDRERERRRAWRAANRDKVNAQKRRYHEAHYVPVVHEPLPMLYPDQQRGTVVSFWEDELRIDIMQERALAALEGRDPDEAERAYRSREKMWQANTLPYLMEEERWQSS